MTNSKQYLIQLLHNSAIHRATGIVNRWKKCVIPVKWCSRNKIAMKAKFIVEYDRYVQDNKWWLTNEAKVKELLHD